MSEYDSILKEKKKKKEPIIKVEPPKKKKFPTISLSIISVIIALIISYIVYYNTILAQDKIIINNLNTLRIAYQNIFNNLNLESFNNDNIEGLITYNETNNYSFIKDKDNYYLKTPSLNKYINNKYATGVNINVDNILENVSKDKYIKTFYLEGKVPVVQIDLVLERVELEKIIGMKLINEYEAIITSRNHALTNEILSIKVVINNKINSDRKVITYENNTIYYDDLRLNVSIKNNDFNIKIYRNDTLYSVITGNEKTSTYDYSYQIIDELYTLNLSTKKEGDKYIYEFKSSIDGVTDMLNLELSEIKEELYELVEYQDLTIEDEVIYNQEKENLLNFIDKYKDNVQSINN